MVEILKTTVDDEEETEYALHQIRLRADNFSYILASNGKALVIDPSEASPVLDYLKKEELELTAILLTHYHEDHIAGVKPLKGATDCRVLGPMNAKFALLDQDVGDEEEISIGLFEFQVLTTPGHTADHVVYYIPSCHYLFTGDTLFLLGCGRIFEGTVKQLYQSLERIKELPPETLIFPGHDYFTKNLAFALEKEPHNVALQQIAQEANVTFQTLKKEIALNPFLHANSLEVFTRLRKERDAF